MQLSTKNQNKTKEISGGIQTLPLISEIFFYDRPVAPSLGK